MLTSKASKTRTGSLCWWHHHDLDPLSPLFVRALCKPGSKSKSKSSFKARNNITEFVAVFFFCIPSCTSVQYLAASFALSKSWVSLSGLFFTEPDGLFPAWTCPRGVLVGRLLIKRLCNHLDRWGVVCPPDNITATVSNDKIPRPTIIWVLFETMIVHGIPASILNLEWICGSWNVGITKRIQNTFLNSYSSAPCDVEFRKLFFVWNLRKWARYQMGSCNIAWRRFGSVV